MKNKDKVCICISTETRFYIRLWSVLSSVLFVRSYSIKYYYFFIRSRFFIDDETKAEKTRKKNEDYQKKLKIETEFKAIHDKITELTKKYEHLKYEKMRVFEYLKRVLAESKKYCLEVK